MHRNISPASDRRHVCELEAESYAFIVCKNLGLDTSRYSFAYSANWAAKPSELLPAAERACKAADEILEALRGLSDTLGDEVVKPRLEARVPVTVR